MYLWYGAVTRNDAQCCDSLPLNDRKRISSTVRSGHVTAHLNICVPHLGFSGAHEYKSLIEKYDPLWLDTTMALTDYFQIENRIELGAYRLDRIMYGSDFPNIPYAWDRELKWLRDANLTGTDLEMILNKNAAEFLGFGK